MDDQDIEVRSPAETKDFSCSLCVQTGSEAHPASCTMGTGGPFPRGKARLGRDADHSPHLVPRSRMSRSYISSPPSASVACSGTALLKYYVHKLSFTCPFVVLWQTFIKLDMLNVLPCVGQISFFHFNLRPALLDT
jgi:hypothetical protein